MKIIGSSVNITASHILTANRPFQKFTWAKTRSRFGMKIFGFRLPGPYILFRYIQEKIVLRTSLILGLSP